MSDYGTYAAPHDPTDVVGVRIGAWVIDLIIYIVFSFALTAMFGGIEATSYEDLGSVSSAEFFCDNYTGGGVCIHSGSETEGSALVIEGGGNGAFIWGAFFIAYVLIQGITGGSPGKLAVGLRVVDASGQQAGIGKSFVRTLAWIGDAITCGLPIVGGVMLVSNKKHQRLGDMLASTYVVRKTDMGRPVTAGYSTVGAGAVPGFGAAPPGPGGWPGSATPPAPGGWPEASPPPGPTEWGQAPPSYDPTGQSWTPPPPAQSSPQAPGSAPTEGPTWDPSRNTYIQYDQGRGEWLQWNDDSKQWGPISQ